MKKKVVLVSCFVTYCAAVSVRERVQQWGQDTPTTDNHSLTRRLDISPGTVSALRARYEAMNTSQNDFNQDDNDETSYPGYYGLHPIPFFTRAVESPEEQIVYAETMMETPEAIDFYEDQIVVPEEVANAQSIRPMHAKPVIAPKPKLTKKQKRQYGMIPEQKVSFDDTVQQGETYHKDDYGRSASFDSDVSNEELEQEVQAFVDAKTKPGKYDINKEDDRLNFLFEIEWLSYFDGTYTRFLNMYKTKEGFVRYILDSAEFIDFLNK